MGGPSAPAAEPGARSSGRLDMARHLGMLLGRDQRTYVRILPARPDGDTGGARHQALDQLVRDAGLDQQPRAGRADLPRIAEGAIRHVLDQPVQVGIGKDEKRILAAELEDDGLCRRGRRRHDLPTGLDAAREGHAAHQRMADQRLARLLAEAGDDVDDPGRQPGLHGQLRQPQRRERRLLGRLEDGGAAGGERRGERADGHAERKIPGRHMRGDAQRLHEREVDEGRPERHRRALDLVGGAGIVVERRHRPIDIAPGLLQRLADIQRLEPGQLLLRGRDALGQPTDHPPALGRCHLAPRSMEGPVRRANCPVDIAPPPPVPPRRSAPRSPDRRSRRSGRRQPARSGRR